ncbi:hypothetical protein EMIHUDRAFT_448080, partial [Emiliania huxleyi CCMP1516]|uniref:Uncharacterized protein n=2 Tax=Emiliania huxleyi TaxID=2903 RepID=A0A0D3J4R6_EMIH1
MLFIYNDTSGSCSPGRASAGGLNYFLFLSAALRAAGLVTTDPQRATVFYHPACLINVYFETRLPNWKSSGAVAAQATAVQRRVLAEIATYQHRPHLLNGLRCALQSGQDGLTSHMRKTFPLLWGSRRFAHFCAEALGPVDHSRAVHLWYCQPEQQEAASSHRPVRVLFVGATFERAFGEKKEHPRARAIRALRRTAGPADHLRRGAAGAVLARRVRALSGGRHARVKARLRRASRRQRPAAQLQVCAAAARLVEVLLRSDRVQPLLWRRAALEDRSPPAAAARLPAGRPAARRAPDARRVHLRRDTERALPRVPAAVAGPCQGRGRRASGEIARGAAWACCNSGAERGAPHGCGV